MESQKLFEDLKKFRQFVSVSSVKWLNNLLTDTPNVPEEPSSELTYLLERAYRRKSLVILQVQASARKFFTFTGYVKKLTHSRNQVVFTTQGEPDQLKLIPVASISKVRFVSFPPRMVKPFPKPIKN